MSKDHIVVAQNKLDYRMILSLQKILVQPRSACATALGGPPSAY
jgi:hypothetical protein